MLKTVRTTTPALPWVAAMVLLSAVALAGPNAASAQSAAKDLKCKKCVSTKEIRKKAISKSRLKNDAVNFNKLDQGVEDGIKQDRTFFETLDGNGAEATLVTQGSLRLFARCLVNDGGFDRLLIFITGSQSGWLISDSTTVRTAGEVVQLESFSAPIGTTRFDSQDLDSTIAPDGAVIGPFPLIGFGINLFGHNCIVHGRTSAITGAL